MQETIRERLELHREHATKLQNILIDYLADTDYSDMIYLSITELAELTGVAEATILRFCRQLGFNGYQDFKLHVAREQSVSRGEEEGDFIQTISGNYIAALERCREQVNRVSVERAVDLIVAARCVSAFGVGNSIVPALEFHNRLMKLGVLTQCERDAHLQSILVSSLGRGDCLVLFSVSGGTKDVLDVATLAQRNGVSIVAVTGHDKSPLTRLADVVLTAVRTESPAEGGAMVTKVLQLFWVDVLCTGIFLRDKSRYAAQIDKSNRSVVDKLV